MILHKTTNKIKLIGIIFTLVLLVILLLSLFYYNNFYLNPNFGPKTTVPTGIYQSEIELQILNPIPFTEIRFTTNGTAPNPNSEIYSNQVIKIEKSTILRAVAFRNGEPVGKELVNSYILISRNRTLPILNLVIDENDLYSDERGIYNILNFEKRGSEWERNANFIFYEVESISPNLSTTGKARIYGAKSRTFPRKSFNICFDKPLNYKIYTDSLLKDYECLTIRNSGNDFNSTLFRDAFVHKIAEKITNLHIQNYRPVILYLNNKYMGIYNIREFIDNSTLSLKYGGKSGDYAVLFPERSRDGEVAIESGNKNDAQMYYDLGRNARNNNLTEETINKVTDLIDIDSYYEYQIIQTFFQNLDYIDHNVKVTRYNGFLKSPNTFTDGKFRWLLYDADSTMNGRTLPNGNVFSIMLGEKDLERKWPYVIFKELTKDSFFRDKFINKYTYYLNSHLKPDMLVLEFNSMAEAIKDEVPFHIKEWENFIYFDVGNDGKQIIPLKSIEDWEKELEIVREFLSNRRDNVFIELNDSYKLGGVFKLAIENDNPSMGFVNVNGIEVKQEKWEGNFFNHVVFDYKAIPYDGYEFSHWEIDTHELKKPIFKKKI